MSENTNVTQNEISRTVIQLNDSFPNESLQCCSNSFVLNFNKTWLLPKETIDLIFHGLKKNS